MDLIDTQGIKFEAHLADVEQLNIHAAQGLLPVTKLSFNAFLPLTKSYSLLDTGSALGRNCGPLLISRDPLNVEDLYTERPVAIPGVHTTANFLLDFFLPRPIKKLALPFETIETAVLTGEVAAGVIIHENRFTYAERGLKLIKDLGSHWEQETGQPIPLGGIVASKSLDLQVAKLVEHLIRESIDFATENTEKVMPYIRQHAQEMDDDVMMKHIDLYVNTYSRSLGQSGRTAIQYLFDHALKLGRISSYGEIFLP